MSVEVKLKTALSDVWVGNWQLNHFLTVNKSLCPFHKWFMVKLLLVNGFPHNKIEFMGERT